MTNNDIQVFGFMLATILIVVVNLQNALDTFYWTGVYVAVLVVTIAFHFIFHVVLYSVVLRRTFRVDHAFVGVAQQALSTVTFWFTLLLVCAILLLPVVARE
jgi:phospholipid-translocating ATPase